MNDMFFFCGEGFVSFLCRLPKGYKDFLTDKPEVTKMYNCETGAFCAGAETTRPFGTGEVKANLDC